MEGAVTSRHGRTAPQQLLAPVACIMAGHRPVRVILGCGWMLVKVLLEQRVVGVMGLDDAGSRIRRWVPKAVAIAANEPSCRPGMVLART
jgi:hypothetical protein